MGGATAAAATLALVAGCAGSIQVAVMGRFGERIGTVEALVANLAFSTLVATAVLVLFRGGFGDLGGAFRSPWWYWIGGGGMGVLVVFSITVCAPRIGATATIGILIAGQLAAGRGDRPLRVVRRRAGRSSRGRGSSASRCWRSVLRFALYRP